MTRHNDSVTIEQLLESAREAIDLSRDRTRQDFQQDRLWTLAIERLLGITGEAAGRLSEETKLQFSNVPWPQIIAFHNRLIHGYDSVDYERVWQIINLDLPTLIIEIESQQ